MNIKKIIGVAVLLVLAVSISGCLNGTDENTGGPTGNIIRDIDDNPDKLTVYFFWGDGCPHCAKEKPFLDSLEEKYPELEVKSFETWYNQENAELFQEVAKAYGIQARGVPTTFIGEEHWVGFSSSMEPEIEEYVKNCIENGCENPSEKLKEANE